VSEATHAEQIDILTLEQHAEAAETLLKAMANRSRLMVLCVLHDGEFSVGELNARIPLSQSALSQHLATLRRAGLVTTRRAAQTVYYRLSDRVASALIAVLHAHFCGQVPAAEPAKVR
jgi:DNA-binding transcriptional ArsR family regulator